MDAEDEQHMDALEASPPRSIISHQPQGYQNYFPNIPKN